jgi:hypothetical protein
MEFQVQAIDVLAVHRQARAKVHREWLARIWRSW